MRNGKRSDEPPSHEDLAFAEPFPIQASGDDYADVMAGDAPSRGAANLQEHGGLFDGPGGRGVPFHSFDMRRRTNYGRHEGYSYKDSGEPECGAS